QEFAERLGLRRLSVARYEAGRIPRMNILKEIARAGGVSVDLIITTESESLSSSAHGSGSLTDAELPQLLVRLLRRLRRPLAAINTLPSRIARRSYEHRSKIVLSRAIRDLAEYQALVERHSRRRDGKRYRQ